MTAIEDQQLAGLLMWVPMGVVYFGACLGLTARLMALGFGDAPTSPAGAVIYGASRFSAPHPRTRDRGGAVHPQALPIGSGAFPQGERP